jgi:hypothetical protein
LHQGWRAHGLHIAEVLKAADDSLGQPWLYYWLSWLPQSLVDLNQKLNWVKVSLEAP